MSDMTDPVSAACWISVNQKSPGASCRAARSHADDRRRPKTTPAERSSFLDPPFILEEIGAEIRKRRSDLISSRRVRETEASAFCRAEPTWRRCLRTLNFSP
ncbi:uncharacterized protein V6R79_018871 [Siganus canaliculatus]